MQISEACSLKSIYLVELKINLFGKLGEGIHKPVQSGDGDQVETSLPSCGHIYTDLGIERTEGRTGKGRTEKLVKVG